MTSATPPRFVRALVERFLSADDRAYLLPDLDEAYAARRDAGKPVLGWYLAQAVHAVWTRRVRRPALVDSPVSHSGGRIMNGSLKTDILASVRGFRHQRGTLAIIVLSLALGIGAASAMFSVTRAVLLAPLPYGEPDGIVMVWSRWSGYDKTWISGHELLDYRERTQTLADVAAWSPMRVTLTGVGDAARVGSARVTSNLFEVLGAQPAIGRTFTEVEAVGAAAGPAQPLVVVLGHGLWQRQFGGLADAVGRTLDLDGRPALVVGVMPREFRLPTDYGADATEPSELWIPLSIDRTNTSRGNHGFYAAARLRDGATPAQANDDLTRLTREFNDEGLYPAAMQFTALAVPIDEEILGPVRPTLMILLAAVAFLLLIACANAAALLLARAEARQREFATRGALGAGRWRLVRQQFVEGLMLAVSAGAAGLGLSVLAKRGLQMVGSTLIPRADDVVVDWRVFAFMLGASTVAALLCTLPPALRAYRVNLVDGLKDGNTQATAGQNRLRLRSTLVVAQLALAVLLLAGAGLTARSLWSLQRIELGFEPSNVLTARVAVPSGSYDTPEKVADFFSRTLDRLRTQPGVVEAGLLRVLPLGSTIGDWSLTIDGYTPPPGDSAKADWQVASSGALEALGIEVLAGRSFATTDSFGAMTVALVNETMARAYWPDGQALGGQIHMGSGVATVVGVVEDLQHNGVTASIKTKIYVPFSQFSALAGTTPPEGTLVIKTTDDPVRVASVVQTVVRELDPNVPVTAVRSMDSVVATALTSPRLASAVLLAFAGVALLLSAIGVYGLLVYLVAQRSHEIGIRMAIGARRGQIIGLIFRQGVRLAFAGIAIGTVAAALASQLIAGQLHQISPLDPATFLSVPAMLLGVALVATLLPALWAARVSPLNALGHK